MYDGRNFLKPTEQSVPVTACALVGIVRYSSLNYLSWCDLCPVKFTIRRGFCVSFFKRHGSYMFAKSFFKEL